MDAGEQLKKTVKATGEVTRVYGGFEITVLEPDFFPWYKIIKLLIDIGQEIWVNEEEGKICIVSKPKAK